MVLDSLSESLRSSLDTFRDKNRITEEDIEEVAKDVQRALLQADVEVETVKQLSENIKSRALNEEPPAGVSSREYVLTIVYEELRSIIGGALEFPLDSQRILLVGLHGSGKTTTSAKIGWWFRKKGLSSTIIQTDTTRPGAFDQSKQLADEAEIGFYGNNDADDPVEIAQNGLESVDNDVKIVDTEGRHALEDELFEELERVYDEVQPDYTLLVVDAATGKGIREQAIAFNESVGIDGVVITKMDGTAKGGGALTATKETDANIAFLGTGEGVKDIERFEPDGFVSRLLGFGDLKQLQERVERASVETEEDWDPESALEGDFTLHDMRKQLSSMNNMGSMDEILDMIPGFGGADVQSQLEKADIDVSQETFRKYEVIMDSMTEEEMSNPSIINKERKRRIARGSGKSVEDVSELLKHYRRMDNVFDRFGSQEEMQQAMQKMQQGGGRFGGL